MKRITVTLTEEQFHWVTSQLLFIEDVPLSHPENQFIKRILDKFVSAYNK